jgi:hypothetical protein
MTARDGSSTVSSGIAPALRGRAMSIDASRFEK